MAEETKEITLDMTVFMWEDEYYAVWSQRQFVPKDLGAWLYMAKLDKRSHGSLLLSLLSLQSPNTALKTTILM